MDRGSPRRRHWEHVHHRKDCMVICGVALWVHLGVSGRGHGCGCHRGHRRKASPGPPRGGRRRGWRRWRGRRPPSCPPGTASGRGLEPAAPRNSCEGPRSGRGSRGAGWSNWTGPDHGPNDVHEPHGLLVRGEAGQRRGQPQAVEGEGLGGGAWGAVRLGHLFTSASRQGTLDNLRGEDFRRGGRFRPTHPLVRSAQR